MNKFLIALAVAPLLACETVPDVTQQPEFVRYASADEAADVVLESCVNVVSFACYCGRIADTDERCLSARSTCDNARSSIVSSYQLGYFQIEVGARRECNALREGRDASNACDVVDDIIDACGRVSWPLRDFGETCLSNIDCGNETQCDPMTGRCS